jgi:hypothetical protein
MSKKYFLAIFTVVISLFSIGCKTVSNTDNDLYNFNIKKKGMKITSPSFAEGEIIPDKFGCKAENVSPELNFSDIPVKAKNLVLIMDDPDAPMGTFTHWIVFNVPSDTSRLKENASINYPQGTTDFGKTGYGGPCPPSGTHRYYFTLYALDIPLDLSTGARLDEVKNAMQGHIIDKAQLMGKYSE